MGAPKEILIDIEDIETLKTMMNRIYSSDPRDIDACLRVDLKKFMKLKALIDDIYYTSEEIHAQR